MGMMINRRRVCGGKSLPYDAEIEYLESTGTQYIDTGQIPTTNTSVKIKATVGAENFYCACGCGTANYQNSSFTACSFYNGNIELVRGSDGLKIRWTDAPKVYGIDAFNRKIFIDDITAEFTRNDYIPAGVSIFLFGIHYSNYNTKLAKSKIYYAVIEDNNTKLDLIPVRVGNVGYMYDKVSKQLFGNAGTGAFILGPDI